MPRPDNYRFQNLARLLGAASKKGLRVQDIRNIDLAHRTTYFTDLNYGPAWPAFVGWFGMEDALADLFADYSIDLMADEEVGETSAFSTKFSAPDTPDFTPTRDPVLREALDLDRFETGWLTNLKRTSLTKELKRAGFLGFPAHRFSVRAQANLGAALYAARHSGMERIFAFCLAEVFLAEIEVKLIQMRDMAERIGAVFPVASRTQLPPPLATLIEYQSPELDQTGMDEFFRWSFGDEIYENRIVNGGDMLNEICNYVLQVAECVWPSRQHCEGVAGFLLDAKGAGPFLKAFSHC